MQLTVTIDFDLPRDADALVTISEVLAVSTGARAEAGPLAEWTPADQTERQPAIQTPPEEAPRVVKKRGRPAKTAVVPVPEAEPVRGSTAEEAAAPIEEEPAPAPVAEPESAPGPWIFTEDNTRHYQEASPVVTIDDVKAALMAYFEKDKVGAINLVRSYGVRQYTQVPPEKFATSPLIDGTRGTRRFGALCLPMATAAPCRSGSACR
jgi:hypothetical protein